MSLPANRKHRLSRMSPPTKQMKLTKRVACIEDLPPEMICELFEYLHPRDLAACSLVNKRWHSIFAGFKMHRLAATVDDPPYGLQKLYDSNEPILQSDRCPLLMFCRLAEKPLLSNLKYLSICGGVENLSETVDLNQLNRFRQLVHLEIKADLDGKVHFSLPKLKVLAFECCNLDCALSIDCPLLSTLEYFEEEDANLLEMKQPETIKKLKTNMVSPKWLARFKCVECLINSWFEKISMATLLSLPGLRELRCNETLEFDEVSSDGINQVDRLKRKLSKFLDEAKKLKGSDFRFSYSGLQLTNANVDQIVFGVEYHEGSGEYRVSKECVYMKNYQLIEPGALDFVYDVDYTSLVSHVTGEFPRCFSQKFTGIAYVAALDEVKDADHFLWFLKSLKFLITLDLYCTKLSQEFYDQLPSSAPSLRSLCVRERHEKGLQLNFDFVGKFSYLSEFGRSALSSDSLRSFVRLPDRLIGRRFEVRSRKEEGFSIKKKLESAEWTIKRLHDCKLLFETENLGEIVNFFDGLQDDTH